MARLSACRLIRLTRTLKLKAQSRVVGIPSSFGRLGCPAGLGDGFHVGLRGVPAKDGRSVAVGVPVAGAAGCGDAPRTVPGGGAVGAGSDSAVVVVVVGVVTTTVGDGEGAGAAAAA